jgi:hypothetical protein
MRRCIEMFDDLRIVVRNGIHVVEFEVFRVVCVLLGFVTTEKTLAAIEVVIRSFTVHKTDTHAVHRDAI